jgi:flagellar hook-associated protein 3 FlgL
MAMRISTPMTYERGVSAMLDQQRELSKTQLQVATGKRILSPEDDPAGAARVLDLNQSIDTVTQYQKNITQVKNRLETEEAALIGAENVLQRARELTVQAANDTLAASDRLSISYEITQLRDELLGLANSKDANGEYIFAGYQGNASPAAFAEDPLNPGLYDYHGDQGQRLIRISHERQIADGDNGFEIFVDVPSSLDLDTDGDGARDTTRNILETLDLLAGVLAGNPPAAAGLGGGDPTEISHYIDELDNGLNNLLDIRAKVGARMNTIGQQEQVNDDFVLSMEAARSDVQDLDYAEAISRFEQELTALQASQQSFMKIQDLSLFKYL